MDSVSGYRISEPNIPYRISLEVRKEIKISSFYVDIRVVGSMELLNSDIMEVFEYACLDSKRMHDDNVYNISL